MSRHKVTRIFNDYFLSNGKASATIPSPSGGKGASSAYKAAGDFANFLRKAKAALVRAKALLPQDASENVVSADAFLAFISDEDAQSLSTLLGFKTRDELGLWAFENLQPADLGALLNPRATEKWLSRIARTRERLFARPICEYTLGIYGEIKRIENARQKQLRLAAVQLAISLTSVGKDRARRLGAIRTLRVCTLRILEVEQQIGALLERLQEGPIPFIDQGIDQVARRYTHREC